MLIDLMGVDTRRAGDRHPSVTCQMPEPSCASTPRTTSAIDGSTITSRVPRAVFTFGKISGCASIPRASPITGIMVARTMPFGCDGRLGQLGLARIPTASRVVRGTGEPRHHGGLGQTVFSGREKLLHRRAGMPERASCVLLSGGRDASRRVQRLSRAVITRAAANAAGGPLQIGPVTFPERITTLNTVQDERFLNLGGRRGTANLCGFASSPGCGVSHRQIGCATGIAIGRRTNI